MGIQDDIVRYLTITKHIAMGSWLVFDGFQWAHSTGLVKLDKIKDITRRAFKCWFVALVASILTSIYKLRWNAIRLYNEGKMKKWVAQGKTEDKQSALQKQLTT